MNNVLKFESPEQREVREALAAVEEAGGVISGPDYIFTRQDLSTALDRIVDSSDWKGPIDKVIPRTTLKVSQVACEFFTATTLNVFVIDDDYVRVTSPGYRAGPAGDH